MSTNESRRKFIKSAGLITAAALIPSAIFSAATNTTNATSTAKEPEAEKKDPKKDVVHYRKLGNTPIVISTVSVGTGSGQTTNVLNYAFEKGINFVHTCRQYAGGKSLNAVTEFIKGKREKVVIGMKVSWDVEKDEEFDKLLKSMETDYVDIAFFQLHKADEVKKEKYKEAAARWKKSGKIKAIGLTSHGDTVNCMQAALELGYFDVLMPSYNLSLEKNFEEVFKLAAEKKVSVILMKTNHGLDAATYEKAVAKYLSTPAVITICKSLNSFKVVNEMIEWANFELNKETENSIKKSAELTSIGHCGMCSACTTACPNKLPVSDVVRCSDYYMTNSTYATTLKDTIANMEIQKLADCTNCGACELSCPRRVPVRNHIARLSIVLNDIKNLA